MREITLVQEAAAKGAQVILLQELFETPHLDGVVSST
jgi:hypothetical protein